MNRDKIIMKNIKRLLYIFVAGLVVAIFAGYVQAAEKKPVEKKATVVKKAPAKKVEPKKAEEKKALDPNRKIPTLKKKYRKE